MRTKVGVIGLGTMGSGIATKLRNSGFLKKAYDTNPLQRSFFCDYAVEKLEDMRDCNIVIISLPDSIDVELTMQKLVSIIESESIVLNISTIDSKTTLNLNTLCQRKRINYIESPIIGGRRACMSGKLLLLSSNEKMIQEIDQVVKVFSDDIIYFKRIGDASNVKLVHNLVTLGNAIVAIESLIISKRIGLDIKKVFEVFEKGTASSYVIKNTLKRNIFLRDNTPGYKLRLAKKDLILIKEILDSNRLNSTVFNYMFDIFNSACLSSSNLEKDYPVILDTISDKLSENS